jgi:low affinity Fe/Cu permease
MRPPVNELFRRFSRRTADVVGSPWAFALALAILLVWAITGPIFHFSDSWQLVINTGTSVVTFLMVFVIQASQNRDSKALHLKLDELIRAIETARTEMVDLEERPEAELKALADQFKQLGEDEVAGGSNSPDESVLVDAQSGERFSPPS